MNNTLMCFQETPRQAKVLSVFIPRDDEDIFTTAYDYLSSKEFYKI